MERVLRNLNITQQQANTIGFIVELSKHCDYTSQRSSHIGNKASFNEKYMNEDPKKNILVALLSIVMYIEQKDKDDIIDISIHPDFTIKFDRRSLITVPSLTLENPNSFEESKTLFVSFVKEYLCHFQRRVRKVIVFPNRLREDYRERTKIITYDDLFFKDEIQLLSTENVRPNIANIDDSTNVSEEEAKQVAAEKAAAAEEEAKRGNRLQKAEQARKQTKERAEQRIKTDHNTFKDLTRSVSPPKVRSNAQDPEQWVEQGSGRPSSTMEDMEVEELGGGKRKRITKRSIRRRSRRRFVRG